MNPISPHQIGLFNARRLLQFGEKNGNMSYSPSHSGLEVRSQRGPISKHEPLVQQISSSSVSNQNNEQGSNSDKISTSFPYGNTVPFQEEVHHSDNDIATVRCIASTRHPSLVEKPRSMLAALFNPEISNHDCDRTLKSERLLGIPVTTNGTQVVPEGLLSSGTMTAESSSVKMARSDYISADSIPDPRWMNTVVESRVSYIGAQPNLSPPPDIPPILIKPSRRAHQGCNASYDKNSCYENSLSTIPGHVVDPATTFRRR
jgi:hypothetical protein